VEANKFIFDQDAPLAGGGVPALFFDSHQKPTISASGTKRSSARQCQG